MTYQIDVLNAQKVPCLSRCVRAHIVVVKNDPSLAVGFSYFSEDFWPTNAYVPFRTDRLHTYVAPIHYGIKAKLFRVELALPKLV